jgi:antitoxin component YwqK of YwqJK toxin-antitoxin module
MSEATFKDGKEDGLVTNWDKDGNGTEKSTFKDGEFVK